MFRVSEMYPQFRVYFRVQPLFGYERAGYLPLPDRFGTCLGMTPLFMVLDGLSIV